jgi:hypothetical protein
MMGPWANTANGGKDPVAFAGEDDEALGGARVAGDAGEAVREDAFRGAILGQASVWMLEITRRHPGSPHQPHRLQQRLEARL